MKNKLLSSGLAALMLASTIVTMATPSEARHSRGYCDAYARDYANDHAGAQQILTGTAVGAGTGALIGAVVPGLKVGTGALIGAGVGTLGGGIHANKKWKKYYRRAYEDCRSY
jgi:uncharacterized protein YcfJ